MESEDPVSSTGAGDSVYHGGAAGGRAYPAHSLTYAEASAVVTASPGDLRTFDSYQSDGMYGVNASGQHCRVDLTPRQHIVLDAIMRKGDNEVYQNDFQEEPGKNMNDGRVRTVMLELRNHMKNVKACQIVSLQDKAYYLSRENNPGAFKYKGYSLTKNSMIKDGTGKHLGLKESSVRMIKALMENEKGCTIDELAQKCSLEKNNVRAKKHALNDRFRMLDFGNIKIVSNNDDDDKKKVCYLLHVIEEDRA